MNKALIALLPVSMVLMAATIHLNQLDDYAGQIPSTKKDKAIPVASPEVSARG